MTLAVEVVSGARRGLRRTFEGPRVTVGRHPDCDLQFDPEEDRTASARHAVLLREEGRWLVRDLGSRNGTFVGGSRVDGSRRLRDGDRVRFGAGGPSVRVRLRPSGRGLRSPAGRRWAALGLLLLLAAVGAVFVWSRGSGSRPGGGGEAGAAGRVDSTLPATRRAVDSLGVRVSRLEDTPRAARRSGGPEPSGDRAGSSGPRTGQGPESPPPDTATGRDPGAGIDLAAIESRNWRAIARVYAEGPDGQVGTATAFSVRPEALLITARHAVLGPNGEPSPKIGVQFARSRQVWPAELVATTDSADLALIRARNVVGEVPVVASISARPDTLLASNRSVAVVGYSGSRTSGRGEGPRAGRLPRPRVAGGLLVGRGSTGLLEIRGPGGEGGSGSPIFDAGGQVIGVLHGGARPERAPDLLVAVPSSVVRGFLAAVRERTGR